MVLKLPRRRGFTNIFRIEYDVVNVGRLSVFAAGTEVTSEDLLRAGLIKSIVRPIKILGAGEIGHPLIVRASKFSASAVQKIVAAGGKAEQA